MKGVSIRRVVSRSAFAAAGLALVAGIVAPHVGAQTTGSATGTHPRIFGTTSNAVAVDYIPDQEGGLTPIKDSLHMQFVSGTSAMSSSNGPAARASVVDPGQGVQQGPPQACPLLVGSLADNGFPGAEQFQPLVDTCVNAKWPYTTQADGFTPDNKTDVGTNFGDPQGQLSGEGGQARAINNQDDGTSSTDAAMGAMRSAPAPGGGSTGLPLPPAFPALPGQPQGAPTDTTLFTTGSMQSTTTNLFDGSTVVSHCESRLQGLRIFAGLVTIDSITSIAESRFGTGAAPVGTSSTTVQGVQVLGQPATIDDKGVHPAGNPADDSLNQLLASAGLTIRLVGATQGLDDKGFMTAQSDGLAIDYERPVDTGLSLPPPPPNPILSTSPSINGNYFVRYNLATVQARALGRDLAAIASSTGGSSFGSSATSGLTSTGAPSGFTGGSATAPPPAQGGGDAVAGAAVPTVFGVDFDLRWLYLAFTLTTLGLCIAPRIVLPARLPR